jgi:hypothetical protein
MRLEATRARFQSTGVGGREGIRTQLYNSLEICNEKRRSLVVSLKYHHETNGSMHRSIISIHLRRRRRRRIVDESARAAATKFIGCVLALQELNRIGAKLAGVAGL